jgi:hypothetical protein
MEEPVNQRILAVLGIAVAAISLAAVRPIAMRVEIEPVAPSGDDTTMSITVQVAPEDRRRLGQDFWIQGELTRKGERVDRLARAVDMDENGQAGIEVAWPPGEYDLQIEVEGTQRGARGVWYGRITVPDLTAPTPSPTPRPSPVPEAEPAPPDETETDLTETDIVAAGAAGAAAMQSPPSPDPEVVESLSRPSADTTTPPETAAESAAEPEEIVPESDVAGGPPVAGAAAAGAAMVATSEPEEPPAQEPTSDETPADRIEQPAADEAVEAEAMAESASPAEPAPTEPEPAAAPAEPPPAAAHTGWPSDASSLDLTVLVTERNRPILGLSSNAFRVRVASRDVPVLQVGDGASSPVNLAFAVGLSEAMTELRDEVSRQLARFALRSSDGRGEVLLATPSETSSWVLDPNTLAAAVAEMGTPEEVNLADLVTRATGVFQDSRGRSFLIVVTDGADTSSKADWKAATAAADAAGVPIFVIGLRDSGFSSRARSSLGRMADTSGARRYFLADPGMLEMTLDFIGELVDASYALNVDRSLAASGAQLRIDGADRAWDVGHSSRVP